MLQLDHIVLAAPDLAGAKERFQRDTGVAPVDGGPHVGLGTRNALVSFGGGQYLEIIAPDPEQVGGDFSAALARLGEPELLHWAVRVEALEDLAQRARGCGFEPGEIRRTSRAQPSGELLVWELMGLVGHGSGGFVPFFIDWLDSPHPADTSPQVGALTRFVLALPAGHPVHVLLAGCAGLDLVEGEPFVSVRFESPRGEHGWDAARLAGFRM